MRVTEHKTFAIKIDEPPTDSGEFTGYAAVFGNVDKGNDLIEPGAATKTVQENPEVPLFWVHNYGLVPIGTGTMSLDGKGVRLDGRLFLESSELAREVFGAMKGGAVKGLSIGYNTLKRSFKGAVRHLQEIAIGEVSLAPFAMNPQAEVDGLKAVKWLGQWENTESVDCLLSMIGAGADFLASEVLEGDEDDAARMQTILTSLTKLLASELTELQSEAAEDDGSTDIAVYVEVMRAPLELAIKSLTDVLEKPAEVATSLGVDAEKKDDVEPEAISTLRALADSMSA